MILVTLPRGRTTTDREFTIPKIIAIKTSPAATDVLDMTEFPWPMKIIRARYKTDIGTVDFNLERRTSPDTAGTDLWSADKQATSTIATATEFTVITLRRDDFLFYAASAVASSPAWLHLYLTFAPYTVN